MEVELPNRRHRYRSAVALGALLLIVTACGPSGSGNLVTEHRDVAPFTAISVSEGIEVELVVDPTESPTVAVTFDDNLLERVVTEVRGGTLFVEFAGSVRIIGGGRNVRVTAQSLHDIEVSGGAALIGTGAANSYRLSASGGSSVDLRALTAADVEMDASGGSSVVVYASASAQGDASGGSSITVYGEPPQVNIDTSGGSGVDVAE